MSQGTVSKKEFYKAIKALGFPVAPADTDAVFDSIDKDKSGSLEYAELHDRLRSDVGHDLTLHNLKRAPEKADRSRTGKLSAKNINARTEVAIGILKMMDIVIVIKAITVTGTTKIGRMKPIINIDKIFMIMGTMVVMVSITKMTDITKMTNISLGSKVKT